MLVYHRTFLANRILREGFRDAEDYYMTTSKHCGVWFSNRPLDMNEGAAGDVVLCLEIPSELFRKFEWVEDGKPYRESLIPASEVNKYGRPTKVEP